MRRNETTRTHRLLIVLLGAVTLGGTATFPATATAGSFAVMTYNVRGLPPVVIEDRTDEISKIGPLLQDFHTPAAPYVGISSVVGLEEVFYQPYYNTLTGAVNYTVETPKDTDGPTGIGDGLVVLSDFPLDGLDHEDWQQCFGTLGQNGSDCDTDKGFTWSHITLEDNVSFDLYTMHADAGQDSGSRAARRDNIEQLVNFINTNSPVGTPVIVVGDTNSLYTRLGDDNIQLLPLAAGLTDVWVQLRHGGVTPEAGPPVDSGCAANPSGGNCELIDKIFYRDGGRLTLAPQSYEALRAMFSDDQGELSDHTPVAVTFDYAVVTTTTTSSSTSTSTSTSTTTTLERPCGDPTGPLGLVQEEPGPRKILSSDALYVLKVAVSIFDCPLCTCDVDSSGKVTANDALRVLKKAVGQTITLNCPLC